MCAGAEWCCRSEINKEGGVGGFFFCLYPHPLLTQDLSTSTADSKFFLFSPPHTHSFFFCSCCSLFQIDNLEKESTRYSTVIDQLRTEVYSLTRSLKEKSGDVASLQEKVSRAHHQLF